jgi:hypothetical protein
VDCLFERGRLRRVVRVVVRAVQRQVADRDLGELEVVRRIRAFASSRLMDVEERLPTK